MKPKRTNCVRNGYFGNVLWYDDAELDVGESMHKDIMNSKWMIWNMTVGTIGVAYSQ
jgi:hypothetical protein